jgi:hypothetical protein
MMNDTKNLFQQSRERMIFTRTSSDISALNPTEYDIKIPTSSDPPFLDSTSVNRFMYLGKPPPTTLERIGLGYTGWAHVDLNW